MTWHEVGMIALSFALYGLWIAYVTGDTPKNWIRKW